MFVASLASVVALFVFAVWIVQSNAIDIIGLDMNVVWSIQKMLLGSPLYTPPESPPYDITQYSPLYYLCVFGLAKVLRIVGDDALRVTVVARAFSVITAVVLSALCYRFMDVRLGASRRTSFIGTAFILAATSPWYFTARPDGLAALFAVASFYFVSTHTTDSRWRAALIAAGVCAVCAVLSKQTGIYALVVLLTFLATNRAWRAIGIVAAAATLSALMMWFDSRLLGTALWTNIVEGVNNGISWRAGLLNAYGPFFYWFAPLLACSLVAIFSLLPRTPPIDRLVALAAAATLTIGALTALKRGSSLNYFNDFIVLGTFAVVRAFFAPNARDVTPGPADSRIVSALAIYLLGFFFVRTSHELYAYYLYHRASPETRLTSQAPAVEFVRRSLRPGATVIGFSAGLSNMLPRSMIVPQQELAQIAHDRRLVDYSRFRTEVARGQIEFLITRRGEKPRPLVGATFSDFKPVREFRFYSVYGRRFAR